MCIQIGYGIKNIIKKNETLKPPYGKTEKQWFWLQQIAKGNEMFSQIGLDL